jgi:hypothetical protein
MCSLPELCLFSASRHHDRVVPLLLETQDDADFVEWFVQIFWVGYFIPIIYTYCQELMKLAGSHGSSFTAIPGEGDNLTLCEQLS